MSLRDEAEFERALGKPPWPSVFVESGTFKGKTTRWALDRFNAVHTIELSPSLYADAVEVLGPLGAQCHYGDTRDVLPMLAREITEPAVWFLDAHWCLKGDQWAVAGKAEPLPLADELGALARRRYGDRIIVDDVASVGRDDYQPGWGLVNTQWVADYFPGADLTVLRDCLVVQR